MWSDLEAQKAQVQAPKRLDPEYYVSTATKATYLGIYFLGNVLLTIYCKAVLGKVRNIQLFSIWAVVPSGVLDMKG